MSWAMYSFLGALMLAMHVLCITKLTKFNLPGTFINAAVFSIVAILLVGLWFINRKTLVFHAHYTPWILMAAISAFVLIVVTL